MAWGIWAVNISINQLMETSRVLCYSAKWLGKKEIYFDSEFQSTHKDMITGLWELLSEADVVCHYNGDKFDLPVINREFLMKGMSPPDSYKSLDLLRVIKRRFRFVSNKLDHIAKELDIGEKLKHEGQQLWLDCMNKVPTAWKTMEKYNKQDVNLLEKLYKRILPWIDVHPNQNLYLPTGSAIVCPTCGGKHLVKKGMEHLKTRSYQRYKCRSCGSNIRDLKCVTNSTVAVTQSP